MRPDERAELETLRRIVEAHDRGWNECLDEAVELVRDARDGREAQRRLVELSARGPRREFTAEHVIEAAERLASDRTGQLAAWGGPGWLVTEAELTPEPGS